MTRLLELAAIAAVLYGARWRWRLYKHPYAPCRWCRGKQGRGRNKGSTGDEWGRCKHCGGKGERLRWGAKG